MHVTIEENYNFHALVNLTTEYSNRELPFLEVLRFNPGHKDNADPESFNTKSHFRNK